MNKAVTKLTNTGNAIITNNAFKKWKQFSDANKHYAMLVSRNERLLMQHCFNTWKQRIIMLQTANAFELTRQHNLITGVFKMWALKTHQLRHNRLLARAFYALRGQVKHTQKLFKKLQRVCYFIFVL